MTLKEQLEQFNETLGIFDADIQNTMITFGRAMVTLEDLGSTQLTTEKKWL